MQIVRVLVTSPTILRNRHDYITKIRNLVLSYRMYVFRRYGDKSISRNTDYMTSHQLELV